MWLVTLTKARQQTNDPNAHLYSYSTASHLSLNKVFAIDRNSSKTSKKCYKHPDTIALAKDANGKPIVMRIMISSTYIMVLGMHGIVPEISLEVG